MDDFLGLDTLDLSRFQFATTSVFHYFFVSFTVGFALIVAILQTIAYRTKRQDLENLTRFFGHLFFINFAVGVVTGIVQEFQFGMNWQFFSTFVGNIFGVPLALEVLMAFFLESTFMGIWWFGKDRLPKWVTLTSIWIVAWGTSISAFWHIIANAWMQHPVGFEVRNGRAVMTDFAAIVFNPKGLEWFVHIWFGCLAVAGFFVVAVSAYHLKRDHNVKAFTVSLRVALVTAIVGSIGAAVAGHHQGQTAIEDQPMKYAAFSALWETPTGNSMPESIFAIPSQSEQRNLVEISIPYLGSFLAFNSFTGTAEGLLELQAQSEQRYGPGNYIPPVAPVYWAFRIMVGAASAMALLALLIAWQAWRRGPTRLGWVYPLVLITPILPHMANFAGWVTTEMGRQPWIVQGQMLTANAVSDLPVTWLAVSLAAFWLIYLTLIGLDVFLLTRTARAGMHEPDVQAPSIPAPSYEPEGANL